MQQILECVPNISEGRDQSIIDAVASVVHGVDGVKLLDVDAGAATNRTVITFAGEPSAVIEAAFLLVKKASELIDMSKQTGAHPRMGATDVCPLVPVAGMTLEDVVPYAHALGERIGRELGIPGYFYESAAKEAKRKNLANCRSGEYEGLSAKFQDSAWQPDFGDVSGDAWVKTGATAVSARNFLVAYNINLNTTSTRWANAIAFDIRERGRVKREGGSLTGKIVKDAQGNPVNVPGELPCVKGIGWFIEEYGVAQISYNLTDISVTSMHAAFDATCQSAERRGLRVTGSELIGLVPLQAMLDAGKHYLAKQKRSSGVSDAEIIKIAIKSMGLDELGPFDPAKRIIEYQLADAGETNLVSMSLTDFANETASESPAPGGGSIAAYAGALGASLATMVANLSAHKRGWSDQWEVFSKDAEQGMAIQKQLLSQVDKDTAAFNRIMEAFGLAKGTDEEIAFRLNAIQLATKHAIEVPLDVMQTAMQIFSLASNMVERGNPNSVTDAAVAALCARTAVEGAWLNVRVNCADCKDAAFVAEMTSRGEVLLASAHTQSDAIVAKCHEVIGDNQ